jgi:hypothetical protein
MMKTHAIGRVYKLENHVDALVYIGETTQTLSARMAGHRGRLKKGDAKNKLYEHMRLIGVENFKPMILLETLLNCTKEVLTAREDFYIKQFDTVKNGLNGRYEDGGRCEHGRQRTQCIPCGGGSICEHQRERVRCKECGGSGICVHQRQRALCKDCGGASMCEHQRVRVKCKDCNAGLYRCLICDLDFCGKQSLQKHNDRRHGVPVAPVVE